MDSAQLRRIMRSPATPEGTRACVEALVTIERRGQWGPLFRVLRPLCHPLARRFRDVATPDEIESEWMLDVYNQYVGDWLRAAQRGATVKAFGYYVRDRLRDSLRTRRETLQRRARAVQRLAGTPRSSDASSHEATVALTAGESVPPDEPARWRELLAQVLAHPTVDALDRELVWYLVHGHPDPEVARAFDQKALAQTLGRSEATVSKRITKIRELLRNML